MGKKKKQEKEKSEKLKKKKLQEFSESHDAAAVAGKKEKKADKDAKKTDGAAKKDSVKTLNKNLKKAENIPDKYSRSILPKPGAETSEKAADVFRAFGDETRLQIMQILEGRELCNSELLQHVSVVQSTLSHHMRVLTDAGVVKCRRYGKYAYYSLCPDRFDDAIEWLRYYKAISAVPVKKEEAEAETGGEDEQQI